MAWTDCVLNPVGCAARKAGGAAVDSAWESFLKWSAQGLSDLAATVFTMFSVGTTPRFDQQWWRENLNLIVAVSLPILVAAFVAQCVTGVVRREPGYLGRAMTGALVGTAGVPVAVGVISACGRAADEISLAILGNRVTADGYKRMTDISAVLAVGTLGGYLLMAILLGLIALFSLYFVMLLREVALLAFVVFAPIALLGWTWSATRHWLRRWIEVVGALLFSKVAMAAVFTLGVSATGAAGQGNSSNLGTFLAGILLVAMAALTPMVTFSFIHWAGDQGYAATRTMQQGSKGVEAARDHVQQGRQWRADHFGAQQATGSTIVGEKDEKTEGRSEDDRSSAERAGDGSADRTDGALTSEASMLATSEHPQGGDLGRDREPSTTGSDSNSGGTPVAVATATATANGAGADTGGGHQGNEATSTDNAVEDVPGPTHSRES